MKDARKTFFQHWKQTLNIRAVEIQFPVALVALVTEGPGNEALGRKAAPCSARGTARGGGGGGSRVCVPCSALDKCPFPAQNRVELEGCLNWTELTPCPVKGRALENSSFEVLLTPCLLYSTFPLQSFSTSTCKYSASSLCFSSVGL